jgi:DNA polymerase epsilon subunit 1
MQEFCTCAGTFTTTVDAQLTSARLETFRGIAVHFGMPLLLQNVEWILNMNRATSIGS